MKFDLEQFISDCQKAVREHTPQAAINEILARAVIGIYTGREDNIFWRRLPGDAAHKLEASGAKALCEKDTVQLGQDIIHSVTNPIGRLTGAIHIYGGDFFRVPRSEWDAETLNEQPCDGDKMLRRFEQANALMGKLQSANA